MYSLIIETSMMIHDDLCNTKRSLNMTYPNHLAA